MEKLFTKLTNIACAIRNRTGKKELLTLDGMVDGVDEVYAVGNDSGYDTGLEDEKQIFSDILQEKGNRRRYYFAFASTSLNWTDELVNSLKYPIICEGDNAHSQNLFYNKFLTEINVPIIIRTPSAINTFNYAINLQTISDLTFEGVSTFKNTFAYCNNLKNINIKGSIDGDIDFSYSKKLTHDSLSNIVSVLKDFRTTKTFAAPFEATAGLNFNVFYPFIEVDDLGILKYEADAEGSVAGMPLLRDLSSGELNELKYATEISFDSSGENFTVRFPVTKSQTYDCSFKTWQEDYMVDLMESFPNFAYGKFFECYIEKGIPGVVFIRLGDGEPGISFDDELPSEITEATHIAFDESGESITLKFATASTVRTLTIGETNLAKLTSEEKDVALNKGWALA